MRRLQWYKRGAAYDFGFIPHDSAFAEKQKGFFSIEASFGSYETSFICR